MSISYNIDRKCELVKKQHDREIKTLSQLCKRLDECYAKINKYCDKCQENDCMGYIWLLKSESKKLYELGIPILQINNGPHFINSFPEDDEKGPNVSVRYPVCGQVACSGRGCKIYKNRPLVCRLYPIGLETSKDGIIKWVTHLDCLFIKQLKKGSDLNDFENKIISIIKQISQPLLNEIIETYREVDLISVFPDEINNFKPLKGGIENVKM